MDKRFLKNQIAKFLFRLLIIANLIALSFCLSIAQEKDKPITNENFLRRSVDRVLEDCLKEAPVGSKTVWVTQEDENPCSWLVEEEIVSYLQKRGAVGIEPANMREGDLVLSFRIIKLNLEYPEVKSKKFLGKSWVRREAQVFLSFKLTDYRGEVLWSKRGEEVNSDLIERGLLVDLNNKSYPFLSPEVPESRWGQYIEPVAVTIVVGALVYLFFANR